MADSLLARARPLLVARFAGAALTVAVPMVLARALAPASYGTFKQAWLVAQTLALVLPWGTTISLYYFVPREPALKDEYVAQTNVLHLLLGLLSAGVILAGRPLLDLWLKNPELSPLWPWVAAVAGLQIVGAPLDIAWNSAGRVVASAIARTATDVGRGAGMLLGVLFLGRDARAVLIGICCLHALRAAASVGLLARAHGFAFHRRTLARQVTYVLPFGLAFLLGVPQQQFHLYAVAAAVPAAVFAVYSVGTFQLPIVDILYTPISELLQIGIAETDAKANGPRAALPLFHEAVLQLAFALLPLVALLLVVASPFVEFLFSTRYLEAVPLLRIGTLSALFAALPLDGLMRARAQNRFMLVLSAVKFVVTVVSVSVGLAYFGPFGALASYVLSEALARLGQLAYAARLFEVSFAEVLPLPALLRQFLAASGAASIAALTLLALSGPPLLRLAAPSAVFALTYLGIAAAQGALPRAWRDFLRLKAKGRPSLGARAESATVEGGP